MVSDTAPIGEDRAAGGAIRIFIFKSEASPDLGAFSGDLAGMKLPSQFKPWRVVGAVAPDKDPPHKLPREGPILEEANPSGDDSVGYGRWTPDPS